MQDWLESNLCPGNLTTVADSGAGVRDCCLRNTLEPGIIYAAGLSIFQGIRACV